MSAAVFAAVLLAGLLHAGWNALVKTGLSKQASMLVLSLGHALIGLALVPFLPLPAPEAWPWLLGSGLIHMAYQLFLAYAYDQGDLSRVYPIARGAAPILVMLVSLLLLDDPLTKADLAGVALLGAGILGMASGALRRGESRRLVPLALGAALATAGYTLVDGLGARVSGQPLAYVSWLMILSAVLYAPAILALKGPAVMRVGRRDLGFGLLASGASFGAYAIALWAMTLAPIALVGALRETSILFAMGLGWLVFGERLDATKVASAAVMLAGLAVMRLG